MENKELVDELRRYKAHPEVQEKHLERCAYLLEALKLWEYDEKNSLKDSDKVQKKKNSLLSRNIFKHIIRVSGESPDYRATVDFVTDAALDIIRKNMQNDAEIFKKHLEHGLGHEHMYPCEEAFKKINGLLDKSMLNMLSEDISFRALVSSNKPGSEGEVGKLNESFKSCLPESRDRNCPAPALSRYCKTGLADSLWPISSKGIKLFRTKYKNYVETGWDDGNKEDILKNIPDTCRNCSKQ